LDWTRGLGLTSNAIVSLCYIQVVRVYGQCASPAITKGEGLSEGRKYHVCRHRGTEHCRDLNEKQSVAVVSMRNIAYRSDLNELTEHCRDPNSTERQTSNRYNDVIQYLQMRHR